MLNLGSIQLPLSAVTKTFAILAKKGAGKSYTAGVMEEEFFKQGIPFVVFDPIDVHWGLRFNKDGKTRGLPIVVFGVLDNADIQLTDDMGKAIAHAVVEKNISCIISTFGMSKHGQRKLIAEFAEELLRINKNPRHIFIEEAHEYVPQRVGADIARCFSAVESLVVMGRNRGLGVTLINQRAATLNKDVLTQIDTLIAFRNTSPHDRKALQEWVEAHGSEEHFKEFMDSLPALPTGEGWIWSPEWLDKFERVKIRQRETLHPDREKLDNNFVMPTLQQNDVQDFIDTFKSVSTDKNKEGDTLFTRKAMNTVSDSFKQIIEEKDKEIENLKNQIKELEGYLFNATGKIELVKKALNGELKEDLSNGELKNQAVIEMWIKKVGPTGAGKILRFLTDKYPMKFTRPQVALGIGIKYKGSTFRVYMAMLKRNSLIVEDNNMVSINPDLV